MPMKLLLSFTLLVGLLSCGEETITQNTVSEKFRASELQSFSADTCQSNVTTVNPPVDVLFVVDNTGSTLADSFQSIKGQIANTIFSISNDFDYHMYFVPLIASPGENINTYPLLVNNPSSIPDLSTVNLVQPENLEMFAQASGNNEEYGFTRAYNVINYNRSNGIFRENANTVVVMISNGDDTESIQTIGGNVVPDPYKFNQLAEQFKSLTKQYADQNQMTNPLNAEMVRFFSLVAHSSCNGWKRGSNYMSMSQEVYDYQGLTDNNSAKDTVDLCSQDYSQLFQPVNRSIQAIKLGHKYDHWLVSTSSESQIQTDDITITRIDKVIDGDSTRVVGEANIPQGPNDGFEYIGYQQNQNTRYDPSPGEPVTGLVVKLNGNARIEYPDCIIAKTRTPTEYFGYVTIPREPDLETVKIEINGSAVPQNAQNGWSYLGWRDTINIKVPGPTNASTQPPLNKSGYVLQLHGNAIFTNGDTISVFYKPQGR